MHISLSLRHAFRKVLINLYTAKPNLTQVYVDLDDAEQIFLLNKLATNASTRTNGLVDRRRTVVVNRS